jgi:hypothetical protein
MTSRRLTLIGGPTALIELAGFRLLTDPTFDPPGVYSLPHTSLRKISPAAIALEESRGIAERGQSAAVGSTSKIDALPNQQRHAARLRRRL